MKYLHTMIRVTDLDASLDFFVNKLGFVEQRRHVSDKGRFTLVFVACPESPDTPVELTYNGTRKSTPAAAALATSLIKSKTFTNIAPC